MARIENKNILTEEEREQIYQEVWQEHIKSVGINHGVSGNTIRNWCQLTGIPYPLRGELKAHLEGRLQRPELQPVTEEIKKYVVPFRIQFQEKSIDCGEELTQVSIDDIGRYVDRLCRLKIYHAQTDLFGEKKKDIHPMIIKQFAQQMKVLKDVYSGLCKRLKAIKPDYVIDKNTIDMEVFKYFHDTGKQLCETLTTFLLELPEDIKKVEAMGMRKKDREKKIDKIYTDKMMPVIDAFYNQDMRLIDTLQQRAYEDTLVKMFGNEYQEYYYCYYQFNSMEEHQKIVDVMAINELLPIVRQGDNLDRSARVTNVLLKVLEAYAPEEMIVVHPYNVFGYTKNITKYYIDDYKTYVKVGKIILALKLQRETEGMCLSVRFVEGEELNKKIKAKLSTKYIVIKDTASENIESQLKVMLVELIETINRFEGQRSKHYKSSGIQLIQNKKRGTNDTTTTSFKRKQDTIKYSI